ncbi:hypothetical protein LOK46_06775 [Methylobacterium sp. NMS14P]|uniref:hypothetical protein n=1 Tax=Methylobacterium sp. NMS14P TaxID=2894310 RepID=UPI0023580CF6|nr:hypothetical protein [Methylobacterium sp. NMS14P]WCS26534.1 hypothetical protein LOK46_06775 [Methylobacterium sp. NMS14P]
MSQDVLSSSKVDLEWFTVNLPVRGYAFSLPSIKQAFREFQQLALDDGRKMLSRMAKPDGKDPAEWQAELSALEKKAFLVTVSIIGKDGVTKYGQTEDIFESKDLPFPINTIYFTNQNSFRAHANGNIPINRFEIWLEFGKPPIFDTNPLQSEPTPNGSRVFINANELGFFRACQHVVSSRVKQNSNWYKPIHGRFAYDFGLWFIALPYALYVVTSSINTFAPLNGPTESYRVPAFIYGLGLSLIVYRTLFTYLKWAYPVNVLDENKDTALKHRIIFGGLIMTALSKGIFALIAKVY